MNAPAESDVGRFRALIAERMGTRVDDDQMPVLVELLARRLSATGAGPQQYFAGQMLEQTELGELSRILSVVETYFLRNRDQFSAFRAALSARAQAGRRFVRVLSAGCSSGEEAYSIAMTIREVISDVDSWNVSITSFDINPDNLERARAGLYRSWSLREMPEQTQQRYFTRKGSEYQLDASIRQMVRFERRNLVADDPSFWRPEAFDFVFCRNVLMYFTPEAAAACVRKFWRSLAPEGHLFLGHAETLRGLSGGFHLCHSHGTFYYRKKSDPGEVLPASELSWGTRSTPAPAVVNDAWFGLIAGATSRIQQLTGEDARHESTAAFRGSEPGGATHEAMHLWRSERFRDALDVLADVNADSGSNPDDLLLKAMVLLSNDDAPAALQACEQILQRDDLNAGAHYIKALCQEHSGHIKEAAEHATTAAYLDPAFAMPHLHLGLLAKRRGDLAAAQRELSAARNLLLKEDVARIILFGGGFGREQLIGVCDAGLAAIGRAR